MRYSSPDSWALFMIIIRTVRSKDKLFAVLECQYTRLQLSKHAIWVDYSQPTCHLQENLFYPIIVTYTNIDWISKVKGLGFSFLKLCNTAQEVQQFVNRKNSANKLNSLLALPKFNENIFWMVSKTQTRAGPLPFFFPLSRFYIAAMLQVQVAGGAVVNSWEELWSQTLVSP